MIIGIDIGGANVKLADATGNSLSESFPMWTMHQRLGATLKELIETFQREHSGAPCTNLATSTVEHLAVTMTGELADCFATRRQGVAMILDQVAGAFATSKTSVYAVGGGWLTPEDAKLAPWLAAASNWYALADWVLASDVSVGVDVNLVLDVGSTTIDIIPVKDNRIATTAATDRERLQLGQLLYTGMQRTPVAAMLRTLSIDGCECPVMAERFATSDDAYLALGLTTETPQDSDTADGQPRTRACARARLARMVGEDSETLRTEVIDGIASQVIDAQARQLTHAILRNLLDSSSSGANIVVSGHGRALVERAVALHGLDCNLHWLEELVNPTAARCGPAMAVAWLYENRK